MRTRSILVTSAAAIFGVVACGSSQHAATSPVPSEFLSACGHPGAPVTVTRLPVTVRHADCDLTGVVIRYGETGVTVPDRGMEAGAIADDFTSGGTAVFARVDANTGDVTITIDG